MSRRIGGAVAVIFVALAALTACSSGSSSSSDTTAATRAAPPASTRVRPAGPAADVSQELTGGNGIFLASASSIDLASVGYEEQELVASGTATSYTGGPIPTDGRVDLTEGTTADYRTRVVVRRPSDPTEANGTVVVEWLNVSGGLDANPDWTFMADELVRSGTTWVGVSAQLIGVEGGEVAVSAGVGDLAGKGLVTIDPTRYASLDHPGDAFSYDIYTQVARAIRESGDDGPLGGVTPERVIAIGESQSAFALTTYANGVQPLTEAFDGFLIHSRGGAPLPLGQAGESVSISDAVFDPPVTIRTDLDVPVLMIETETDVTSVIGYHAARQDDTDRIRLWEVAGTAHADAFTVGPLADTLPCGAPINDGPQRFVLRAGIRALDTWVRTGEAPPSAPRLEVTTASGSPVTVRDADANALGGVRLPQISVPVATLSGERGPTGGVICMLLGTTVPFTAERLATLYPSTEDYLAAYTAATDSAIAAGFALPEDRQQILDDADPAAISG